MTAYVYPVFDSREARKGGAVDLVCHTEAEAKRHVRDLKSMGFDEAFSVKATSEQAVWDWVRALEEGRKMPFPKA